jgi:hypothetical protein
LCLIAGLGGDFMYQQKCDGIMEEQTGINIKNETSLHSSLKKHYLLPGDRLEAKVGTFIADILRENKIIEIQTGNFSSIRKKLSKLSGEYSICLVYPVAVEKWITTITPEGSNRLKVRKSPKKGTVYDIFSELIRVPSLINNESITMEVLLITVDEIRLNNGKGSWRRNGMTIVDRQLKEIKGCIKFENSLDFLNLLPEDLSETFSNKELSQKAGIKVNMARKMTYCLKKMGVIEESGKIGNAILYKKIQFK